MGFGNERISVDHPQHGRRDRAADLVAGSGIVNGHE
jgi:hypothetical protein